MSRTETQEGNESQLEIVKPIVKTQDAMSDLRKFEELKSNLLSTSDYQAISGKNFIKKSGWRKLALVFNISDQVIESSKRIREEDGSFVWSFRVRATAPNGRFTEAVACCDSRERRFSHLEHDTIGTAHTRAKSRAISDLIGAGEISAEEIDYDRESSLTDFGSAPTEEEKQRAMALIKSSGEINRAGGRIEERKPQLQRDRARAANREDNGSVSKGDARFDLTLDGTPFPVNERESPFSNFFLGKVCRAIKDATPESIIDLEKDERGQVRAIVCRNIGEAQQREIANTLTWSLKKVAQKRSQKENQPGQQNQQLEN